MFQTRCECVPALGDRKPTTDEGSSRRLGTPRPHTPAQNLLQKLARRVSWIVSRSRILIAVLLAAHVVTASARTPADRHVRLNQIQVIGTHDSYHAGIAPNAAKVWQAKHPQEYLELDYQHPPLPQQLDDGIRQIELDVFADTQGGRYAHPSGPSTVAEAGLPPDPDFDPAGVMLKPGFKVMHIQDVD